MYGEDRRDNISYPEIRSSVPDTNSGSGKVVRKRKTLQAPPSPSQGKTFYLTHTVQLMKPCEKMVNFLGTNKWFISKRNTEFWKGTFKSDVKEVCFTEYVHHFCQYVLLRVFCIFHIRLLKSATKMQNFYKDTYDMHVPYRNWTTYIEKA